MTDLDIQPVDTSRPPGDEEVHVICCDDLERSFCGIPVDDQPVVGHAVAVTCVVCVDLVNSGYCPLHGRCRFLGT